MRHVGDSHDAELPLMPLYLLGLEADEAPLVVIQRGVPERVNPHEVFVVALHPVGLRCSGLGLHGQVGLSHTSAEDVHLDTGL